MNFPVSVKGVVDVVVVKGEGFVDGAAPELLIEVPHGATRARHFTSLRSQLAGPFPDDLIDFFFVNTDVGAPEVGVAVARAYVKARPRSSVALLHCQIPRTFIDCNRIIDPKAAVTTSKEGEKITPGVVSYVKNDADLQLLLSKYAAWRDVCVRAFDAVVPQRGNGGGGRALMLHTYAPRTVDVAVDDNIVQALHDAYRPEKEPTWPLRPGVDLITTTPDGEVCADASLVAAVRAGFAGIGVDVGDSTTYPLHPSTGAYAFARKWPKQTLCLEIRRDLLVKKFTPFQEMDVDDDKVARAAAVLADAFAAAAA